MKKYNLIKDKNKTKAIFIGGIAALTLTLQIGTLSLKMTDSKNSEYNEFSNTYIQTLQNIDYSEYDEMFIDIYKNGIYNINNETYDIDEIYLVTLDDGTNHLIKAGDNDIDILTKETITGKKQKIICFKKTSIFYYLYQDGIIADKNIILDTQIIKNYLDAWDGQYQNQVPELQAETETQESLRKK